MGHLDEGTTLLYGDEILTLPDKQVPPEMTGVRGSVLDPNYGPKGDLVLVALQVAYEVRSSGTPSHARRGVETKETTRFSFRRSELFRESRSILHDIPEEQRLDKYGTE